MKAIAIIRLEKDEFPDNTEEGKERLRKFLEKKLQKELYNNDIEDFELLDEPKIADIEVIKK